MLNCFTMSHGVQVWHIDAHVFVGDEAKSRLRRQSPCAKTTAIEMEGASAGKPHPRFRSRAVVGRLWVTGKEGKKIRVLCPPISSLFLHAYYTHGTWHSARPDFKACRRRRSRKIRGVQRISVKSRLQYYTRESRSRRGIWNL